MKKYFPIITLLIILLHGSSCTHSRFQTAGAYNDSIIAIFDSNTKIIQLLDSVVYSSTDGVKGKIVFDSAVKICSQNLEYIKSLPPFERDSSWQKESIEFFTNDLNRVKRFDKLIKMLNENRDSLTLVQANLFDSIYNAINDESITDCNNFYNAQRHFGDKHELMIVNGQRK